MYVTGVSDNKIFIPITLLTVVLKTNTEKGCQQGYMAIPPYPAFNIGSSSAITSSVLPDMGTAVNSKLICRVPAPKVA